MQERERERGRGERENSKPSQIQMKERKMYYRMSAVIFSKIMLSVIENRDFYKHMYLYLSGKTSCTVNRLSIHSTHTISHNKMLVNDVPAFNLKNIYFIRLML